MEDMAPRNTSSRPYLKSACYWLINRLRLSENREETGIERESGLSTKESRSARRRGRPRPSRKRGRGRQTRSGQWCARSDRS